MTDWLVALYVTLGGFLLGCLLARHRAAICGILASLYGPLDLDIPEGKEEIALFGGGKQKGGKHGR